MFPARRLGDSGDFEVEGSDPYLNAIRAISVPMGLLRKKIDAELNNVSNADATVDIDQLMLDIQQMNQYAAALPQAIAAFRASPAYVQDATTARMLDNWLAFTVAWAGSTIGALSSLPTDAANWAGAQLQGIANSAGNVVNTTAWNVIKGVAPLLLVGGALLFLLESKSRTYRKYAA